MSMDLTGQAEGQTSDRIDVSVVISTYNRGGMLAAAVESVLEQQAGGVNYEVIVVDNNSSDDTRRVVEELMAGGRGGARLRYVFEGRQGLSHARNTGIGEARGQIVAFTDDDVRAAPDWVWRIKRAFDEHPEVEYVGGKVLPLWEREPPEWLTRDHWSPLALVDHGDKSFYLTAQNPYCVVGANLAFRRRVFEQVGVFTPEFQRFKEGIGSTEDHEFMIRIWQAGEQGFYDPGIVVAAEVQAERVKKEYHRRWYAGHGRFSALMNIKEITSSEGHILREVRPTPKLFGTPAYVYRELLQDVRRLAVSSVFGREKESSHFSYENKVRHGVSYVRKKFEQHQAHAQHSGLTEVFNFFKQMIRKKMKTSSPAT